MSDDELRSLVAKLSPDALEALKALQPTKPLLSVTPPPPVQTIVADPAEVLALRVVVGILIAHLAARNRDTSEGAQGLVNNLSATCQEALLSATIFPSGRASVEQLRRDAIDHVNRIVGTAQFNDGWRESN
jgi:hypothetical protein